MFQHLASRFKPTLHNTLLYTHKSTNRHKETWTDTIWKFAQVRKEFRKTSCNTHVREHL